MEDKKDIGLTGLSGGLLASILALNSYKSKEPQFKIYEDLKEPKAKFRWQIMMSSDIVAASSQGYSTRELCLENAKSILSHLTWLKDNEKLK